MGLGSKLIVAGVVVLGLIQLVPYGRTENPPVSAEPGWDSQRTRELFFQACGDCHSNQTEWPWYSAIAPASWLVRHDVDEARSHFNVSEWGPKQKHGDDASGMIQSGEMPLWYYLPAHPEARLTEAETAELIAGLERMFGTSSPDDHDGGHSHDDGDGHGHDHGGH